MGHVPSGVAPCRYVLSKITVSAAVKGLRWTCARVTMKKAAAGQRRNLAIRLRASPAYTGVSTLNAGSDNTSRDRGICRM